MNTLFNVKLKKLLLKFIIVCKLCIILEKNIAIDKLCKMVQ